MKPSDAMQSGSVGETPSRLPPHPRHDAARNPPLPVGGTRLADHILVSCKEGQSILTEVHSHVAVLAIIQTDVKPSRGDGWRREWSTTEDETKGLSFSVAEPASCVVRALRWEPAGS